MGMTVEAANRGGEMRGARFSLCFPTPLLVRGGDGKIL
jgi:hypothetical protein